MSSLLGRRDLWNVERRICINSSVDFVPEIILNYADLVAEGRES